MNHDIIQLSDIELSINLSAPADKLMKLATSFEDYPKYLESSIKSVKIIEKNNDGITTEEIFVFKSLFDHELVQKSKHTINDNSIHSEIIGGPFKGTIIDVIFDKTDSGTKVSVKADYKISLKYKILGPLIKQKYRIIIIGLLYKMNSQLI